MNIYTKFINKNYSNRVISRRVGCNLQGSWSLSTLSLGGIGTHEVFNQSSPLVNINSYLSDPTLQSCVHSFISSSKAKLSADNILRDYGKVLGREETMIIADLAERNPPILRQFDQYGRRIDVVEYHPSYHALMKMGLSAGAASHGYNQNDHVTRAALISMQNQIEPGHCCPIVMTCAAIPVFKNQNIPQLSEWSKKVLVQDYDPSNKPIADKNSITMGMSMTEKQGGSDVRANTTIASPLIASKMDRGDAFLLRGHKWFTSAPMCDGFFTLAKLADDAPPSLFLVPRWLPDGQRNKGFRIMRLKNKCADRANGSSEIEYDNAWGLLVSEPGKGVKAIIDMVSSTRLDCCLGSVGTARRALQHVLNHTNERQAFGSKLINQPLMENLLTDLCIETEAHTVTAMRLAAAFDRAEREHDEREREIFRIGVAVAKYYITKRLPNLAYECMEIYGGNGFDENFPMAKIFRHSPLNSIWEGSGNVMALDVLRGMRSMPYLLDEISLAAGMDTHFDAYMKEVQYLVNDFTRDPMADQRRARYLCDRLATCLEASLLLRFGNPLIAEGYISSRIREDPICSSYGSNYGNHIYSSKMSQEVIQRNMPVFQ